MEIGAAIDMSDPEFWSKILLAVEATAATMMLRYSTLKCMMASLVVEWYAQAEQAPGAKQQEGSRGSGKAGRSYRLTLSSTT